MPGEGVSEVTNIRKRQGGGGVGPAAMPEGYHQPALANARRGGGPFRRMSVGAGYSPMPQRGTAGVVGAAHNAARRRKGVGMAAPPMPARPMGPF